jgi:hypothetical protein
MCSPHAPLEERSDSIDGVPDQQSDPSQGDKVVVIVGSVAKNSNFNWGTF